MASARSISAQGTAPLARGKPLRERLGLGGRARRGERRAFEEIFREHHQEIYRYCLAILRNPADAEDALQSTMSAALRALPGEARDVELRPWLFRVAHNESISIVRRRREGHLEGEPTAEAAGSASVESADRERLRILVSDLKALPDRQRAALVMRELSGLAYGEIAAALDCAEGAARQSVYEARMALRGRAEGREMRCDEARRAISDGDGRRLRGRKLKAHLAACEICADFKAAIEVRQEDLPALCAPIPIAAAGGILAGLGIGGAGAAGAASGVAAVGSGATALGGGVAAGASVKAATVVAAVVVAAGASDATGIVELPGPVHVGGKAESGRAPAVVVAPAAGAAGRLDSGRAHTARAPGVDASTLKRENRERGDKNRGRSGDAPGRGKANPSNRGKGRSGEKGGANQLPDQASGPPSPGKGPGGNPGSNAGGNGPPAAPPGNPAKTPPAPPANAKGGGGAPKAPAVETPAGGGGPPATPPGASNGKGGPPK